MKHSGTSVYLDDQIQGVCRRYGAPLRVIRAYTCADVTDGFTRIQDALDAGYYVAGYAAYELGYALDAKLKPLLTDDAQPLLEFGVYEDYKNDPLEPKSTASQSSAGVAAGPAMLPKLTPAWSQAEYHWRFERLRAYILAGDIYQANLTFPYRGQSKTAPDLLTLYKDLRKRQPVRYGAIVTLGTREILSLSPELFFSANDGHLKARPMKGTAARGISPAKDAAIARAMQADEKSRAENLMIVDLLRNDLSKVATAGSVSVTDLFSLETFPTLHQLTSGIEATLSEQYTITDVFRHLFPCGSVTGAPKIRAMEIIHELEDRPRGPYCGAIGYFDPNGNCSFNVAIRTLTCTPDTKSQKGGYAVEYNVGSGVVYDSSSEDEYAECLLKARIISPAAPRLVETLKWSPDTGFAYLEGHMLRLMKAANARGYPLDAQVVMAKLDAAAKGHTRPQRVRLTLSNTGATDVTRSNLTHKSTPLRLKISPQRVSSADESLTLKTSPMPLYDAARAELSRQDDCDEFVFLNEREQITEGSYTNVFLKRNGRLLTPPLSCGLLAGVLRRDLLDTGKAIEAVLTADDLKDGELYVGNSVRGLLRAALIG